ncbi:MAG: dynamin family protein [archaeon]|nr:dynamin family protein [archaeon]
MDTNFDDKIDDDKDNELFKKLRRLINLVDQLRDCGVQEYIQLPRIASLGTQSSGKSSVLESIVGLDFLPRGDGVVTRRPLELRLCHISEGDPWAVFAERKGVKFTDFNKVRETIETLTDEICVGEKNIVDKPIVLNVYSPTCPDLTLIDLPGITRVPVGRQPKNIEEITKNMAKRYCEDPLTVILCVIAANSDIATSDGLKMAKEIDTQGVRTLGVLTKLDIMDKGTDARKALMGEEIELRLGYVGVKNRSKKDLMDKISMQEAFKREREFFQNHPAYKTMAPGYYGTNVLIQKLTKILFRMISQHLPNIIRSINDNIKKSEEELSLLGQPMPLDEAGKLSLLWSMLNDFCNMFRNTLQGKYDRKRSFLKNEGGYKIKNVFLKLLNEFTGDYKATKGYSDEDISYAIDIHEGDSIPGFPSVDAFFYLVRPQLEKLREPINEAFNEIFTYLEGLSQKIMEKAFTRFPQMMDEMVELVNTYLQKEKDVCKKIIDTIVEQELNYLYTVDQDYLDNYTAFVPKHTAQVVQQPINVQGGANPNMRQTNQNLQISQSAPKVDNKKIFVVEMRKRVEAYFKLIVRNLRDSIPKAIGNFILRSIQEKMQLELYNMLYKGNEILNSLNEPESVTLKRQELTERIKVMRDAQKVIKRDPDLMQVMKIDINDNDITNKEK